MKNILLLNGGKSFGHSAGRLSETLHNVAKEALCGLGFNISETHIDKGYKVEEELQKILDSKILLSLQTHKESSNHNRQLLYKIQFSILMYILKLIRYDD